MKKVLFLAAFMVIILFAGVATAGCSSCGGDYPWTNREKPVTTSVLEDQPLFTCDEAKPFLGILATTGGILFGALLLSFSWLSNSAHPKRKRRAFKYGLLPASFFFMQSLFCVGMGLLVGCTLSVFTSGFGIFAGVLFALYTIYELTG
ncbi:MAG TPA: hypothetical protein ENN76_02680 [Euryarchaeota archaeon]|nr:hypothetical protein [Euryarchaeota archaeon]